MMIESLLSVKRYSNSDVLDYEFLISEYPNGELNIQLEGFKIVNEEVHPSKKNSFEICINIVKHSDFFKLVGVKQHIDQILQTNHTYILNPKEYRINLVVGYMLYGRQDRIFDNNAPSQNLPQKLIAEIINSLKFDHVTLLHSHSDSLSHLINNCRIKYPIFMDGLLKRYDAIIAPDLGSSKLLSQIATFNHKELIVFHKERCIKTGTIKNIKVVESSYEIREGDKLLIIDDLCDGGATFIALANNEIFKKQKCQIDLYVCHGLFTKGLEVFKNSNITDIFTSNFFEINQVKNGAME